MQKQIFSTVLDMVKALNALLVIGFVFLGITCSVLSICLYQIMHHKNMTLVPPVINKPFTVSQVKPDKTYLEHMGLFLLGLKYNLTPETVHTNHEMLLGYINPAHYASLLGRFTKEEKSIRAQKISSVFYPEPKTTGISLPTLQMKISGTLKKWVGTRPLTPETVTLILQFDYQQGLLSLKSIGTAKKS